MIRLLLYGAEIKQSLLCILYSENIWFHFTYSSWPGRVGKTIEWSVPIHLVSWLSVRTNSRTRNQESIPPYITRFVSGLPGLAFSRPKKQMLPFYNRFASKFLRIYYEVGLLWVYRSLYSKIQNFSFLKTEFGIFQLQAPGNPGLYSMYTHTLYTTVPHRRRHISLSWEGNIIPWANRVAHCLINKIYCYCHVIPTFHCTLINNPGQSYQS